MGHSEKNEKPNPKPWLLSQNLPKPTVNENLKMVTTLTTSALSEVTRYIKK